MARARLTVAAALVLAGLAAAAAGAQEGEAPEAGGREAAPAPEAAPSPYEPVRRDPVGSRLINLPTPFPVGRRGIETFFSHRFTVSVEDGSSRNLYGLDSSADIGLGVAVGVSEHLQLEVYRSSFQENFEISGKFLLFEQAPAVPLSLALRAGVDLPRRTGVADDERPFVQVLLMRQLRPGVNLLLAPSFIRDTPRLRDAFNVPFGLTFGLPGGNLIEIEVVPENRDLDESVTAWHVAYSRAIGRHIFELVLGNSRATTVDQYLGGDFAGGFEEGDVRLGFNIVRGFRF